MRFVNVILSVSALAVAALALSNPVQAASDPAYNPATAVSVSGIISSIRDVPAGQPLEGVHVILKNKTNSVEVYLGPRNFLNFLKTGFSAGEELDVMGSRVKAGNTEVILAREVSDGVATITLRDPYGTPAWKTWGVEADSSAIY